jgi:hypothetical protein
MTPDIKFNEGLDQDVISFFEDAVHVEKDMLHLTKSQMDKKERIQRELRLASVELLFTHVKMQYEVNGIFELESWLNNRLLKPAIVFYADALKMEREIISLINDSTKLRIDREKRLASNEYFKSILELKANI